MKMIGQFKRAVYGLSATVLTASVLLQVLSPVKAHAYGQITERQIQMSSSALGGTSTSYFVSFKPATSGTVKSIAVDFCQNDPILNDSCTGTVGTNTPTLTAATVDTTTALIGNIGAGWTITLANTNRTFTIAKAAGVAVTAGTAYYFTINLVTNPTDNDTITAGNQPGTFYARVLTFPNDVTTNYAGGYTANNLATNVPTDAGGIALSTANQITITSKVQERLVFCVFVSGTDLSNDCVTKTGSTISLGDTNGVLDPNGPYVDKQAQFAISTNAQSSAVVNVKGGTLTSGANTITTISAPATVTAGGTEQFGLCTYQSQGAGMTVNDLYDGHNGGTGSTECTGTTQSSGTGTTGGGNSAYFNFDTAQTNSTYGQTIATKPAGNFSTARVAFAGNISNSTEAGIYTTTLTFIATGTY